MGVCGGLWESVGSKWVRNPLLPSATVALVGGAPRDGGGIDGLAPLVVSEGIMPGDGHPVRQQRVGWVGGVHAINT